MDKVKELWNELNVDITINKRELVLGIMTCLLAGILLGIFFSPRKRIMIGSNNGNNNVSGAKQDEQEMND